MHGDAVLAQAERPLRHGHAEALFPMIERVMAEARLRPEDLGAVAAATGPGGFTGIRVGLAAAHGIALATGARLVGITSFDAVAARLAAACMPDAEELRLVALDRRRADFYVQLFAPDASSPLAAPQALLPDGLAAYVAHHAGVRRLLVAGDAAAAAAACLDGTGGVRVAAASAPDALGVAFAASRRPGGTGVDDAARPLYLRPPDVTMPAPRAAAAAAGS